MRKFAVILLTATLLSGARSQEPETELPQSCPGRAAKALVAAVNAADEGAVDRWTKEYLSTELFHDWTPQRFRRMLLKLREQSGGVEVVRVLGRPEPHYLTILLRPRRKGPDLGVELIEHSTQKGRLHALDLHPFFPPPPGDTGAPTEKLPDSELALLLEKRLTAASEADRFSGVTLIARGDRMLLHRAYGRAGGEANPANTLETRFHTGSVGKMFTAVAVAQLVEAGKLKYEDTLETVLPGFLPEVLGEKVTLNQLLTHTAGIPDVFASPQRKKGIDYRTLEENLALVRGLPLDFEPGTRHQYSNGGFSVLAAVVQRVAGMPFARYVREMIYRPAGMDAADAAAYEKRPWAVGFSHQVETDPLGIEARRPNGDGRGPAPGEMPGFGAGYLTAQDLFRFFRALRTGKLLKAEGVEQLVVPRVEIGGPLRMGRGFYHLDLGSGATMRGHSGGGGSSGIGAHAEMLWEGDVTLIVLGNYDLEQDVRPLTLSLARLLARQ